MVEQQRESTIVIRSDIRERLKKIGYKGQTYNEIISKLLDLKGNKNDSLDNRFESLRSREKDQNHQSVYDL